MSFSFAQFLLNQTKECNGHLQTETTGLSVNDALVICKELEKLTDHQNAFTIELWTDGSYTIYQMDFWEMGQHPLGHINRMILGVNT